MGALPAINWARKSRTTYWFPTAGPTIGSTMRTYGLSPASGDHTRAHMTTSPTPGTTRTLAPSSGGRMGQAHPPSDVMDLSHAATLDDDHPGFTFQCSCSNGTPEASNNLGYSLLKNGCISTVSASRVSWYEGGQNLFRRNCDELRHDI